MAKRLKEDDYHKLASSKGFKFLGGYTGKTRDKVLWECNNGHEWETEYHNVKRYKCPYCSGKIIPLEKYHELAEKRGFEFLGGYTEQTGDKVQWRCKKCNHEWKTTYNSIQQGSGCRKCFFDRLSEQKKLPKSSYHDLAKSKGIDFIDSSYTGYTEEKVEWKCPERHVWKSTYRSVKGTDKAGCPKCARIAPKTVEDYFSVAKKNNMEWIGKFPETVHTKTKWKCEKGHIFKSTYSRIRIGRECRKCFIERNRGENHYAWDPNKTDEERKRDRGYLEYERWRQSIFDRDNYSCQVCLDDKGGNLVAHHLYSYTKYKDYRVDIDNGITLCERCHNDFHIWMGTYYVPCTAMDFSKWFIQNEMVNNYIKENNL